jgi:hypothetical protein
VFDARVQGTLEKTRELVAPFGWAVTRLSEYVPDLVLRERNAYETLLLNDVYSARLEAYAIARTRMYLAIDPSATPARMRERTLRTASQYIALGKFANEHKCVICNHTTVNLSWYRETETALLHNPISVY